MGDEGFLGVPSCPLRAPHAEPQGPLSAHPVAGREEGAAVMRQVPAEVTAVLRPPGC